MRTVLVLLLIWEFLWKAAALWKAGRNNQVWWFVVLLILNTAGILPILYLRFFQRKVSIDSRNRLN
ncbi:MAG: hypothetical protein A2745_02470 [Candidatus Harrisonbacteria bacterium RIFCSPHIGHO2_01_FULL_44_13]|uniref:DUF5652 domain-containing protein n=1 Tax=Candidatus Harrisonbacteria bacterium RIFCSPLOWO2_01_FULL_44_18 TaxID=1798407 RepID=A0A1G1ZQ99_9BACT|nr:MAG: hypothetical protein A2745_02470 [Candidatus Harrisonbacteria bacterium RIFCSPHIGHO2_01_FULL_44_13]OGY65930.1 MAG: hypothetical protein A3A16_00905 [Candidatus Harrisonbacteria bacterium RIFCSPLOWO2_01_FULL_44_18]